MISKLNVEIGGIPIEIVKKQNLKNLYIRVNPPEGEVVVSAPSDYPDEELKLFILKRLPDVIKVRNKMLGQERQSKREYVSGESYYLWGRPYRLQVIYGEKCTIEKTPNKIILTVPNGASIDYKEQVLTEWYRAELRRAVEIALPRCEEKTGLKANEFRIKNMRTRWGTCNIEKRRIWLNLQLVKKPPECLEYVIIHELVHLEEKNHTHRFNALVEKYCPMWKDAKRLLKEMPLDYLEKGETSTIETEPDNE